MTSGQAQDPLTPDLRSTTPQAQDLVRVVALDGPAGSGKTTVARRVAAELGWRFVDTGATYRAATLAVLRAGVDLADARAVADVAARSAVRLSVDPERPGVWLDDEDVSEEIRGLAVTSAVSAVSAIPAVREHLVAVQRELMGRDGAVVEGRDIAMVVAPQAAVKVYLDATPEVRARRRAGEQAPIGRSMTSAEVTARVQSELRLRDSLDNQTNPLEVSDGALHLDTSDLTLEDVVTALVELVARAGLVPASRGSGT